MCIYIYNLIYITIYIVVTYVPTTPIFGAAGASKRVKNSTVGGSTSPAPVTTSKVRKRHILPPKKHNFLCKIESSKMCISM